MIHQTILDVIGQAEETRLLATFCLTGLTEQPDMLLDAVQRAVRRGVRVRMLIRSRNNVPGHRRDTETLAWLGVDVRADSQTHAKGAIADRRRGALFSANFDMSHGLLSGVEVGTRLDGLPALADAADFFEHSMDHADMEALLDASQRTVDQRLASGWHTPWPHGAELTVAAAGFLHCPAPARLTWHKIRAGHPAGPETSLRPQPAGSTVEADVMSASEPARRQP